MFAPELACSLREPPTQRVNFDNLIDHMARERLLAELKEAMQDIDHPESVGHLLNLIASAVKTAIEILSDRIGVSALFVSQPGVMY